MLNYPVCAQKVVDWDFLAKIQPHNDNFDSGPAGLEEILAVDYNGFIPRAWERLFQI